MTDGLKLRAEDFEDLAVISACLQDARIPPREMAYLPDEQRFLAAFMRYRRELQEDPSSCEGLLEIQSVLVFDKIDDVKYRGLQARGDNDELSLLTIQLEPGDAELIRVNLLFEGDVAIQLRTDTIACRLDDFGDARRASLTPCDHFEMALEAAARKQEDASSS